MPPDPAPRLTSPAPGNQAMAPPAPLPVEWRVSRWRGGKVLVLAAAVAVFAIGMMEYDAFFGWVMLATAAAMFLLGLWKVVFPGSLRLDADGLRWGRKRWAWTDVASFRLGDLGAIADVSATTYRLPATPEEAHRLRVGSLKPDVIEIPASVAGMSPWRAVALLNHHREQAMQSTPQL